MSSKCATCLMEFNSVSEMREHFQSDYHAHNVRLRVDGKRPVTKAQFRDAANGEAVDDRPQFACTLCRKTFQSIQTLQSHVKSTEHLMKKEKRIIERDGEAASMLTSTSLGSAALGLHRRHRTHKNKKFIDPLAVDKKQAPEVKPDEKEEDVSELRCFFCGHLSATMEANLRHLGKIHYFTVPLAHRCTDVEGLMQYLARKINGGMCLVCGEKSKLFSTLEGVRSHMKASNHEHVVLSPEYDDFYEGELDDPEAEAPKREVEGNELVIADGQKKLAKRRDDGIQRFRREAPEKAEERRAITSAAQQASAVMLAERRAAMLPEKKKELKRQRHFSHIHNKFQMQLGVRTNKLHPKGYDGEGEVN